MENIEHYRGNQKVENIERVLEESPKDTEKAVRDVNVVYHYTSNPEVNKSGDTLQRDHSGNFKPSIDLRENDVRGIVFTSSSRVYEEPENIPVSKDAPIKPVSIYGASKGSMREPYTCLL